MAHMTDEEAKRLDEKWTKNPPKTGPNGTGYFTKCNQSAHFPPATFPINLACAFGTPLFSIHHAKARRCKVRKGKNQ